MQTVDPKRAVTQITQRLSLRKPQAEALRRLDDIVDLIAPSKDTDVEATREAVRQVYGPMPDARFEEFERDFPVDLLRARHRRREDAADGSVHQLPLHDRKEPELLRSGPEPDHL